MQYFVDASALRSGSGSASEPFKTIQEAADAAMPGDEVIVRPGIYREDVNPPRGGRADRRIVYRSEKPRQAVICGSERITCWHRTADESPVWFCRLSNSLFGEHNPYTTQVKGDWYFTSGFHTGEVFLNGKALFEVLHQEELQNPPAQAQAWDRTDSNLVWYTQQEGAYTVIYARFAEHNPNEELTEITVREHCFYPQRTGCSYITLEGFVIRQAATQWAPPTAYQSGMVGPHWAKGWIIDNCEVCGSRCVGITLGKYLQPGNENRWTLGKLKHGTQNERDAVCQAVREGWNKDNIGSHIIRRCDIHDCEEAGIAGYMGGAFSVIEDNHVHHIGTRQQLFGAENAGIKLHAGIDAIIRRNHIHHCIRGIWLDWLAQGTRITQNLLHDNQPPAGTAVEQELSLGEDLFLEVSHGPTLVDNNLLLSAFSCKLATQGVAFVHNLICGPFVFVGSGTNEYYTDLPRCTPYCVPHDTALAGFMTILHGDDRFYNNIFVQQQVSEYFLTQSDKYGWERHGITGTRPFDDYPTEEEYLRKFFDPHDASEEEARGKYYTHLPVYTGGNVYCNGAQPCNKESQATVLPSDCKVTVELKQGAQGGYVLAGNLPELLQRLTESPEGNMADIITTQTLGQAFEPEQKFENPDGSPIVFRFDYLGEDRGLQPVAGPFASVRSCERPLF